MRREPWRLARALWLALAVLSSAALAQQGASPSSSSCEIELTYSATGISSPKIDANFAIRNNRANQLNAWQVVWRFPSEKVIPGSVDGAILLSTGSSSVNRGSPARVVNSARNAPIMPNDTRGFIFTAYSTLPDDAMRNVSRAPTVVSVNGLSCEAVAAPAPTPDGANGTAAQDGAPLEDLDTICTSSAPASLGGEGTTAANTGGGVGAGEGEGASNATTVTNPRDPFAIADGLAFQSSCEVNYCCGSFVGGPPPPASPPPSGPSSLTEEEAARRARHAIVPLRFASPDAGDVGWTDCR